MQGGARPSAEVPKACGRWPSGGAHKKIIPDRRSGIDLFIAVILHIIQCIFAALQNKQIERYAVFRSDFIQFFKQRLGKSDGSRHIRTFEFIINFEHFHHPIIYYANLGYNNITIYGCISWDNVLYYIIRRMISMIECTCTHCIYQENNRCMLDNIEVSYGGMCHSAILIYIEDEELEARKKAQRDYLDMVDDELE